MGNMLMVAHAMQLCLSDDKHTSSDAHGSIIKQPVEKKTLTIGAKQNGQYLSFNGDQNSNQIARLEDA